MGEALKEGIGDDAPAYVNIFANKARIEIWVFLLSIESMGEGCIEFDSIP